MKIGDVAITPQITFLDTKANVEAFPDPQEGMEAISSDTHEKGFYNGSAWVWGGGGGGTPGGADTNVQYNDGGAFGGDGNFTWDKTARALTLKGDGGYATIQGVADGSSQGFFLAGGDASIADTNGGDFMMFGGNGEGTGLGGGFAILGGTGGVTDADGGSIILSPGTAGGSGVNGRLRFVDPSSGSQASMDMSGLATDRTFTFPNKDGTFAMLDDTPDINIWDNNNSAGRLWGGVITDAGSGNIDIAAGAGLIKLGGSSIDGNTGIPTAIDEGQGSGTLLVEWDAITDLPLAGVGYNLVFWDASLGDFNVALKEDFYSVFNFVTDFTVGRVYYDGTNILSRLCGMNRWNFDRRVQMFGEERFPVERATGLMISAVGTRNIALTAGVIWAELVNRFTVDAFDSSAGGTFSYWRRDGSGGWTETTAQTQINNTQYDDGDGTLATLANNRYGVHWVYTVHDSSVHVVYGQDSYTAANASAATPPSTLPGLLASYATLVGKIIIKKNASTMTAQSPFTTVFSAGEVSNHNDLAGLQGGTTDEYYHLTAAELTKLGGIEAGAQANVLEGVTGTAPIVAGAIAAKSQAISINAASAGGAGSMSAAHYTKLEGIEAGADVTDAANVGAAIHGATAKTTPVDADTMPIIDSAASNVLKKVTWANIKATVKTYFDTLYAIAAKGVTNGDSHDHAGGDGAQIAYSGLSGLPTITNPPATTGAWDVQVGNGSGSWIKKTWTEFLANFPIAAGTYDSGASTTGATNVSTVVKNQDFIYLRVLNIALVAGSLQVDPTAAGQWNVLFNLPVASTFTSTYDLNGNATAVGAGVQLAASIVSNVAGAKAEITSYSSDGANRYWRMFFMYIIK
jgi:hypothetical protein